jgi:predicted TPR repeat methyltransferase
MKASAFDERYEDEGDPWGYRTSDYERAKYLATLAACGDGPFEAALELAGSIGVFSAMLAPRCRELTTIDFSEPAVAQARRELADLPQATALFGEIPGALPDRRFDLIVASEILYYLEPDALEVTLARLEDMLEPGGRVVVVHWRPEGPERPFTAAQVHERVLALDWLALTGDHSTPDYLLHVLERPR